MNKDATHPLIQSDLLAQRVWTFLMQGSLLFIIVNICNILSDKKLQVLKVKIELVAGVSKLQVLKVKIESVPGVSWRERLE